MLLIGLWHGAGWTFLLWGLFHAALLIIYRIWQMSYSTLGKGPPRATLGGRALARAVTFVAVMVGWMLFNANSVGVATSMFTSMLGMNGISLVDHDLANWSSGITWMILLSLITFWGPNSYQLLYRYRHLCLIGASTLTPYRVKIIHWRPNVLCAMIVVLVALFAITGLTKKTLQFLYFQF